jgi:RimJ/RimL family protein N-acetyltransferase
LIKRWHGRGLGLELRQAILDFGFAGLGAEAANATSFLGNEPALGVTRKLAYTPNGEFRELVEGHVQLVQKFRMSRSAWNHRRREFPDIRIELSNECLAWFS